MQWLNYHHLFYFLVIAQEGGIAAAARKLRITHSTLSTQLRALEAHFGAALFERRGKRLVLTSFGSDAVHYAGDIFRLGRELTDVAAGRNVAKRDVLRIGAVAELPKTLVHELLVPALAQPTTRLQIRQDTAANLITELISGRLHAVIMNDVPTPATGVRIHAHPLGETDVLWYATAALARKARRAFPRSLQGMPFILPSTGSAFRARIDEWFATNQLDVDVKAEVDDAGLLRVLGSAGRGIFPVRAALRTEVESLKDVQLVGACHNVHERYFAITTERRIRHPGLTAIVETSRRTLNPTQRTGR